MVRSLLQLIAPQQEPIQRLEDDIRRLKGGPPRPQLKPSSLEPGEDPASAEAGTEAGQGRPGPWPAAIADGRVDDSCDRTDPLGGGIRRRPVQRVSAVGGAGTGHPGAERLLLSRAVAVTNGGVCDRPGAPGGPGGGHDGPQSVSDVLQHQYDHVYMTQPLLLEPLYQWDIAMSAGPLNPVLTEGHERFHQEEAELKAVGLAVLRYVQADDTGARHPGRNGYCTSIGNDRFAGFARTEHKSRGNFR